MSAVKPSGIVTLLTDFGLTDPFVGVMKGVLLERMPEVRIVDLTHGIGPQDVAAAAFWLARSYRYFTEGTVHVAVVDPGVGTSRTPIAMEADRHYFVAPDNGLLGPLLDAFRGADVRRIDTASLGVESISRTFHGRDVFAPAAAELAAGRRWLSELGPPCEHTKASVLPKAHVEADEVRGVVVTADRFGNLITNVPSRLVARFEHPVVAAADQHFEIVDTYAEAQPGATVALVDAFDVLELARRDGSAAETLPIRQGSPIIVRERTAG